MKIYVVNMLVFIKCIFGCFCSLIFNILRLEGMKELFLFLFNENNYFILFILVNFVFFSILRVCVDILFVNFIFF